MHDMKSTGVAYVIGIRICHMTVYNVSGSTRNEFN